jgi:cysteinyl-tRNA synthetase
VGIRFRDTMTGSVRDFEPLEPGKVRMYNCGPTVYTFAHIGNFRAFLMADLIRRLFEFHGYDVRQVMNITDVGHMTVDTDDAGEDKMQKAVRQEGKSAFYIARFYEEAFFADLDALGIRRAHVHPRASEHIQEMIELVQALLDKGFAYRSGDTILFDIAKFPAYGQLSHKRLEDLQAGAGGRLTDEMLGEKRNPGDFRLWKTDPTHVLQWDSPWGRGYPGWHLECSVMARKYLGDTLDIHTGGEDNIFPHHESERAQIEPITGKPFARYWIHTRHLMAEGLKMSKSLGNFYTVRDLVKEGFDPIAIRYLLLSTHYRSPANFTKDGVKGAWESVVRIRQFVRRMDEAAASGAPAATPAAATGAPAAAAGATEAPPPVGGPWSGLDAAIKAFEEGFIAAVDDDLNMSQALAQVFDFMREVNRLEPAGAGARRAVDALRRADAILGLLKDDAVEGGDAEIDALVAERTAARKAREFARSDQIRDELAARGIIIEDTPQGPRWYRK